jgi:hypothetical protein
MEGNMPIFEYEDDMTEAAWRREQRAVNRKAKAQRIERAKREEEEKMEKLANGEFDLNLNQDWNDDDGGNILDLATS